MSYWHGGPTIRGDMLLPPTETGRYRSGQDDPVVYITPTRDLAATYAATCYGWVYEVEPIGPVIQDPDSVLPAGESLCCGSARILRRWRLSNAECDARRSVVQAMSRRIP